MTLRRKGSKVLADLPSKLKRKNKSLVDLPSNLTVAYLVGLPLTCEHEHDNNDEEENNDGPAKAPPPPWGEDTPEGLAAYLSENGCLMEQRTHHDPDGANEAVLREAAKRMAYEPSFWPKHAPLHPHAGRVKNWLWVHSRYRAQADALLRPLGGGTKPPEKEEGDDDDDEDRASATDRSDSKEEPDDDDDEGSGAAASDEAEALWNQTAAAFRKLEKKIGAHSEFEDEQLFRYFVDHHTKAGGKDRLTENLARLHGQHTDLRISQDIHALLDEEDAKRRAEEEKEETGGGGGNRPRPFERLRPLLESYVRDLKEHLRLEEETLVRPWLQLTEEEYKQYRSYLSWKYCIMY